MKVLRRPGRMVVEHRRGTTRGTSYQLERVKCGKPKCKCARARGALHGPYWYAYSWGKKRLSSRYIGKPGSEAARAAGLGGKRDEKRTLAAAAARRLLRD